MDVSASGLLSAFNSRQTSFLSLIWLHELMLGPEGLSWNPGAELRLSAPTCGGKSGGRVCRRDDFLRLLFVLEGV